MPISTNNTSIFPLSVQYSYYLGVSSPPQVLFAFAACFFSSPRSFIPPHPTTIPATFSPVPSTFNTAGLRLSYCACLSPSSFASRISWTARALSSSPDCFHVSAPVMVPISSCGLVLNFFFFFFFFYTYISCGDPEK